MWGKIKATPPPAKITASDEHHLTLHWFARRGNIEKAIWLVSIALCWNVPRLQCSFWQVGRFEEISQQTANISGQTVERTNNRLNCDLIRHLFGHLCVEKSVRCKMCSEAEAGSSGVLVGGCRLMRRRTEVRRRKGRWWLRGSQFKVGRLGGLGR